MEETEANVFLEKIAKGFGIPMVELKKLYKARKEIAVKNYGLELDQSRKFALNNIIGNCYAKDKD